MSSKEVGLDSISSPSSLAVGLELPHSRTLSLSPLLYIFLEVPSSSLMSVFLAYIGGMFWAYLGGRGGGPFYLDPSLILLNTSNKSTINDYKIYHLLAGNFPINNEVCQLLDMVLTFRNTISCIFSTMLLQYCFLSIIYY